MTALKHERSPGGTSERKETAMTYSDSSTAHLSAWDFHVMTLERKRSVAWEDLPDPHEPEPDDRPEDWEIEAELRRRLPQAVAAS